MVNTSGTSPNLNYEQFKTALRQAIAVLEDGFERKFGYPIDLGGNRVTDAEEIGSIISEFHLSAELARFYASIGEIDLPDVHIGYFVHPASAIVESADRMLPTRVESGAMELDVETFGSAGGGGLFALGLTDGATYYLPGGVVEDGVYRDGLEKPRIISLDFDGFLVRLLSAVEEFAATAAFKGF